MIYIDVISIKNLSSYAVGNIYLTLNSMQRLFSCTVSAACGRLNRRSFIYVDIIHKFHKIIDRFKVASP